MSSHAANLGMCDSDSSFVNWHSIVDHISFNKQILYELNYYVGILAVSEINEAIDRQVVYQTLSALQSSAASLSHVDAANAEHYQQLLARVKSEKAQV